MSTPRLIQKFLIISFLLATFVTAYSQNDNLPEFGKADIKELLMKDCEFDKNAPAIKLLDLQQSEIRVDYDIIVETERRVRIKIFNEKGFDFANISIPYVGRKKVSKIKNISAYIYNLDSSGKVLTKKIENKQIFREKAEAGVSQLAFTFPDLHPGSVIEYRYTKIEKNTLHFDPWYFQDRIPTLISICKITRPSNIPLDRRFITIDSVEEKFETKQNPYLRHDIITASFKLAKIPAFRIEPLMSSIKDNLQRIEFAMTPGMSFSGPFTVTFRGWDIFNTVLLRSPYFGKAAEVILPGADYIIDSAKRLSGASAKLNYIFQEVKRKIKWDEEQTFYADDINDAWNTGNASSAEMNLTILNLIRKAGITSFPLLISTRYNGKTDQKFVSLSQFNGVDIAVFDSAEAYILDGTQKYQSYKTPPYNILNRDAFLIDTVEGKWVSISDTRPLFKNNVSASATIDNKGILKGKAVASFFDFSKTEKLNYKPEDKKEDEEKKFIEKESTDIKIDSLKEENADDEMKPLVDNFSFSATLSNAGDFYFLDPFFLSNFRKNPFSDSLRSTDIDFGSNQYFGMTISLELPADFLIDHLPPNQILRTEDSSITFQRRYFHEGNTLLLRHIFEVKKPIYLKEEYPVLKEFFQKMYKMINEQIVFKKQ